MPFNVRRSAEINGEKLPRAKLINNTFNVACVPVVKKVQFLIGLLGNRKSSHDVKVPKFDVKLSDLKEVGERESVALSSSLNLLQKSTAFLLFILNYR